MSGKPYETRPLHAILYPSRDDCLRFLGVVMIPPIGRYWITIEFDMDSDDQGFFRFQLKPQKGL